MSALSDQALSDASPGTLTAASAGDSATDAAAALGEVPDCGPDELSVDSSASAGARTSAPVAEDERLLNEESAFVVLYVFSGPHLGAELELRVGRYLLGVDDSCDIILHGASLAARHAALTVARGTSGMPECTVTSLDGPVRLDGQNGLDVADAAAQNQTEISPGAGKTWYLGLTCLTWNRPGVPQPAPILTLDIPSRQTNGAAVSMAEMPDGAYGEVSATGSGKNSGLLGPTGEKATAHSVVGSSAGNNDVADSPLQLRTEDASSGQDLELPLSRTRRKLSSKSRFFVWVLLFICLGSLSLAVAPPALDPGQYPGILEQKIREKGLSGLTVEPFSQGVEVRGMVDDEAQLTMVRDLARDLHFPVYLDVTVRGDMLRAASSAFQARGFFPSVELVSPSVGGPAGEKVTETMRVSAYIKDRLLEEGLFSSLNTDVTGLPPIERHIVHQEQLAQALEPALSRAGLDFVQVAYLPGKVAVTGAFEADSLDAARRVLEQTGMDLGIPLQSVIQVAARSDTAISGSTRAEKSSGNASRLPGTETSASLTPMDLSGLGDTAGDSSGVALGASGPDPLGGLRVTGVTTGPLRFATTADGQRLFEGALLPSGYTLEKISTSTLTLRKGGQVITHRLRGSS